MPRGTKKAEDVLGQMFFDFNPDSNNYICQSNDLITARQSLKLNSMKLIRATMMQVVREDTALKPYVIKIKELARLLDVDSSNLYRTIDEACEDLAKNYLYVQESLGNGKIHWARIPWISICEYISDVGVVIELNEKIKPFLLNLRRNYTQYTFENIMKMSSSYAIRVFEMLMERINGAIPLEGIDIEISVEDIRIACDCLEKFKQIGGFKKYVLDISMQEINNKTTYEVHYDCLKTGRRVTSILFHVNSFYHIGMKDNKYYDEKISEENNEKSNFRKAK